MPSAKRSALLPAQAAHSIARVACTERALAHMLAGWAVKLPDFTAKRIAAAHFHRAIERSVALRSRVSGLCHAEAQEVLISSGWADLFEAIDRASNARLLTIAVYRWLIPKLMTLYRDHRRSTDPIGDRASIELVVTFLRQLEADRIEGRRLAGSARGTRDWFAILDRLWKDRENGEPLPLDKALWRPVDRVPSAVRPSGWPRVPTGSLGLLPPDPVHDPVGVVMALHKEIDEEYTTLELISRNSYEHPDMPVAFHRDMARQAADEARHAELLERALLARGARHGDFPLSVASYDGLYQFAPCEEGSRKELLWRILVRQTFDEGLALDNLPREIARRRAAGQDDIAAIFDYILRDEVFHAGSGLRWSRQLAADAEEARGERAAAIAYFTSAAERAREAYVLANLDDAMSELDKVEEGREARGGALPDRSLNRTGRVQAGFEEQDIDQIIELGFAQPD